jgi:hypothetical protein
VPGSAASRLSKAVKRRVQRACALPFERNQEIPGVADDVLERTMCRAERAARPAIGLACNSRPRRVKDYEFQLVQSELKKGDGAVVAVRLVNKKTGRPVPDAVIFAKRLDMAPDGMATMDSPLETLPSTEPGVYRFKTNLMMEGRWQLSLGAKVQGETGSVESKLVLKAVP